MWEKRHALSVYQIQFDLSVLPRLHKTCFFLKVFMDLTPMFSKVCFRGFSHHFLECINFQRIEISPCRKRLKKDLPLKRLKCMIPITKICLACLVTSVFLR